MLYNFLWDDVGRKKIVPVPPKGGAHKRQGGSGGGSNGDELELVVSPTTGQPRPVTIYADSGFGEGTLSPRHKRTESAGSRVNFKFPFRGGVRSPGLSEHPFGEGGGGSVAGGGKRYSM